MCAALKVENLFRRVSRRFGGPRPDADPNDILVNQDSSTNSDVVHLEDSFKRLMNKMGNLVDHSVALVSRMRAKLDTALQVAFLNDTADQTEEPTSDPYSPSRDSGFLQGVGLEEVLDSFFDFGKSVLDEFGAVVTQVFDNISDVVKEEKERGNGRSGVNQIDGKLYLATLTRFLRRSSKRELPAVPEGQEVVSRPSQTDLRVLAAAGSL